MLGKDDFLASELGKGQVSYTKIHEISLPARIGVCPRSAHARVDTGIGDQSVSVVAAMWVRARS